MEGQGASSSGGGVPPEQLYVNASHMSETEICHALKVKVQARGLHSWGLARIQIYVNSVFWTKMKAAVSYSVGST